MDRDMLAQLMMQGGGAGPPVPRYGAIGGAPPQFAPGTMQPAQPGQAGLDPATIQMLQQMMQQQGGMGAAAQPPPAPMPQPLIPKGNWR
jgi:hypothetical protein